MYPGLFNHELSNSRFFNPRLVVEKSGFGKSGVEKFMVEKSSVETSGVIKFVVKISFNREVNIRYVCS